jgi:uncharacterized membrane protein YfcA
VLTTFPVLVAFGCLTGVTTVLFGFGGGFLTVPVVAATAGADPLHTAVATSAAVMVVNASWATVTQLKSGRFRREYLWPLAGFVTVGAAAGAFAADRASNALLHWLFVAYLAVTIVDTLVRRGFFTGGESAKHLGKATSTLGGVGIGAVASFLGVGGSVMTVPLLRRRGLPMSEATAMANPLSVPIAVAGSIVYALTPAAPAPGRLGHIDLVAAAALLIGSIPAIVFTRRLVPRVPDRVHAVAYVALLVAVLVVFACEQP